MRTGKTQKQGTDDCPLKKEPYIKNGSIVKTNETRLINNEITVIQLYTIGLANHDSFIWGTSFLSSPI